MKMIGIDDHNNNYNYNYNYNNKFNKITTR